MKKLCGNLIKFWGMKDVKVYYLDGSKKDKGLFINNKEILFTKVIARLSLTDFKPSWIKDNEEILVYFNRIYKNKADGKILAYFVIMNKKYPAIVQVKNKIIFNFDPEQVIENILFEKYVKQKRPIFTYLPFHYHKIPFRIQLIKILIRLFNKKQNFPSWPTEKSVELLRWIFLKSYEIAYKKKIKRKFWPKGKYAVVLCHDVDSADGFRNIPNFSEIEEKKKVVSTWNVVGRYYKIDYRLLDKLDKKGHEIGLHGFKHDSKIAFLSKDRIKSRLNECLKLIKRYKIKGFRSPALITSPNLFRILPGFFYYDSSVADTEIFVPGSKNRGCCSVFPYKRNGLVEVPLTIPMDSSLIFYGYKPEEIYKIWVNKLNFIKEIGGVAVLTTHPESHFSGNKGMLRIYSKILDFIVKDKDAVVLTAGKVAELWEK